MSFPAADFYGHPRVSQKLHPHNILEDKQAFLVEMLMRFPIDLALVVGHPAMIGKGPIGGKAVKCDTYYSDESVRPIRRVVLSMNPVSHPLAGLLFTPPRRRSMASVGYAHIALNQDGKPVIAGTRTKAALKNKFSNLPRNSQECLCFKGSGHFQHGIAAEVIV